MREIFPELAPKVGGGGRREEGVGGGERGVIIALHSNGSMC